MKKLFNIFIVNLIFIIPAVSAPLTWIGAGSGGAGTDFNTASNWNTNTVPGPLDDCTMNITNLASSTTISLIGNITVNSLNITYTATTNNSLTFDIKDFALTTNGNFIASNPSSGSGSRQITIHVGTVAGISTGALIVKGNAVFSTTGTKAISLTSNQTSRARFEFRGDVTFGSNVNTSATSTPYRFVFTKTSGVQTLTINSSIPFSFSAVEIGNQSTSTPTLTLAGTSSAKLGASARSYLAIYAGSTLDMGTKIFNDSSGIGTDTLILDNSATIKVGGTNGGLAGSNFPAGFGTYRILTNSTIHYNSAAGAQTLSVPGNLYNLVINNSSGVTLSANKTINSILTFINGNLITGANTLTLGTAGSITGESASSYLVGRLSITQNVGTNTSFFGDVGVEIDDGSDNIGNVTILRISGAAGIVTGGGNSSIARSWYITSTADPTVSGRTLTFYWVSSDDNGRDLSQAQVWRNASTPEYEEYSFTQDVTGSDPRLITSYTTFNLNNTSWTVTDATAPLPVELISFDAFLKLRNIELKWVTATELNNQGFNIERRSFDKSSYGEWKSVGFVNGKGTTNENQYYSYEDKDLSTGKYQYRLKQVDFNSNYEYFVLNSPSELVVGKPIAFEVSQNYPNPSNPNSKIDFQIPEDGKVSLKVYNLLGQEVASLVNEQKEAGYHTAIFEGTNLSSGVYFYILNVQSSNQTYSKTMKMVIIK